MMFGMNFARLKLRDQKTKQQHTTLIDIVIVVVAVVVVVGAFELEQRSVYANFWCAIAANI